MNNRINGLDIINDTHYHSHWKGDWVLSGSKKETGALCPGIIEGLVSGISGGRFVFRRYRLANQVVEGAE